MANLITLTANHGTRRWSLLTTLPCNMALFAILVAPSRWPTHFLVHSPTLATSTAPVDSISWISGLELLRCWLRLNWGMHFLFSLGLNLSLSPPRKWLKLGEGTILLIRHKSQSWACSRSRTSKPALRQHTQVRKELSQVTSWWSPSPTLLSASRTCTPRLTYPSSPMENNQCRTYQWTATFSVGE